MSLLSRRSLLQAAALFALPKISFAAAPTRRARRVLVLNLSGGVRSSACFLASASKALNPWGRVDKAAIPIGRLLDDHLANEQPAPRDAYVLPSFANARVTPFRELTNAFSVVGTWDASRGDHERSLRVMATGSTSADAPGLVVKLFAALSAAGGARADGADPPTPPFVIGDTRAFATARGEFARYAAVDLTDPMKLPSKGDGATSDTWAGHGFVPPGGGTTLTPKVGAAGRELVDLYSVHHRTSHRLGGLLSSPALAVMRDSGENTALGRVRLANNKEVPLTNEMIRDVALFPQRLGGGGLGGREGPTSDPGPSLALAIRLLQIGSPAVAIDVPGFDAHSGERTAAPRIYRQLGGMLAGLHFLLSRTIEPQEPGVSMLDRTLVVTTSEFGRDPGSAATGFNGGEGSDHGSHPACFYVAHAVMGAGIGGGRVLGGVSTDTFDARREQVRYAPQRLLATIAHALGIDVTKDVFGFEGAAPIEELWRTA